MRSGSFQGMRLWPPTELRNSRRTGSVTLVTLCLFFIFTSLGFSVLYLSRIHLKLQGFRKNALLLDTAVENGIKQGAAELAALISKKPGIEAISPEEFTELAQNVQQGKVGLLQRTLGTGFPIITSGSSGEARWNVDTEATLAHHFRWEDFIRARFALFSRAQAALQRFPETKNESLTSSLTIAAGWIPLSLIPLLVDGEAESESRYLTENRIEMLVAPPLSETAGPVFSGGGLISEDILSQALKAFKLDIFTPQDLSRSQLRRALGLEIIDEPIPPGVYLIEDDLGLGGVYVEGDCDRLGLAVAGDFQVFDFRIGQEEWRLTFSPLHETTTFASPGEVRTYERTPLGIIIVNGGILSLEAGVIDAEETFLRTNEEIPCILKGVSLSLIASGRITLSTHLLRQGVTWRDEIPVLKDADAQLHIFAAGRNILGEPNREGRIIIDATETPTLKIEASLTAAQTEILSDKPEAKAVLVGSLHTGRHHSGGNTLQLIDDPHSRNAPSALSPRTSKPVLYLADYHVTEWGEIP